MATFRWGREGQKRLSFKQIIGYHQPYRAGFGSISIIEVRPKLFYNSRSWHGKISSKTCSSQCSMPLDKMVLLCLQGHFVGDPLRDTSKTFIFLSRCNCYLFLIYIVGILTHRHHAYFAEVCTTTHVLGTCTVTLQHGCSIFHHDSVLSVLVFALKSFFSSNKCNNAQSNNSIKFLKAGGKSSKYTKKLHSGLL